MLSSGVRNLGKLLAGWAVVLGFAAFAITHFDEIRARLGLKMTAEDFGIAEAAREAQQAPEPQVRTIVKYVEREPTVRPASGGDGRRGRAQDEDLFGRTVSLERGRDGHFRANAEINGRSVGVLVDTGATLVAMSYEDAAAAGISVGAGDFRYVSNTANGQACFARVTLDQVRI